MPATTQSDVQGGLFFADPRRALLTPSASPSVGPPDRPRAKRPRLRSTPSSSMSVTPSTSNESTSSADVNSARKASTLRVLNTWAQLAERYNKRLDEDDIIDLHRLVIIKDRGTVEGAPGEYDIGHLTQLDSDQDYPDADQDQEDSEQDDDENELSVLPPSETTTDDGAPMTKKELLRGVPPLSATTDAEDLREFLEAEKKRRELAGDEEDEEDMSPEQRFALRKELEERLQRREAAIANGPRDVASAEPAMEHEVDTTPTRPSTRVPPSDNESEDELAVWTHDESTAVYPVAQDESEQDVHEVEREVIELIEENSDEEFEAILTHPPHFARGGSPLPVPPPKEVQLLLQSPSDSEHGRSKLRTRSHPKIKPTEVMRKSEDRLRSPLVSRMPEVALAQKRKPSNSKEPVTSDDEGLDQEVVGRISSARKGKDKEIPPSVEDSHRENAPKLLGAGSRGRKRKRIVSSAVTGGSPVLSSAVPKSNSRNRGKAASQSSTSLPRPDGPKSTLDEESAPVRFEATVASSSRSLSSFSSVSKTHISTSPVSACRSLEPESVQLISQDHDSNGPMLSDLPTSTAHPYSQRHPSHSPSIFSSPNQGMPSLSLPVHPVPPMDPVQAQQAHYLLAQAMHQLSYLLSATMPPYAAYAPSPGQSWHHPPPPPSHTAYNTPIHYSPHIYGIRHYHTPSSSISRSGLPSSSPVRSSVSPPAEEQCARSRGRSKSRGRRVSFKLDSGEVVVSREHNIQPELQRSGQKNRRQSLEAKQEREKGKTLEEFNDTLRLEDRGSPSRDVARGRTPGPPSRKKIDVPRGRSLSRR